MGFAIPALLFAFNQQLAALFPGHWLIALHLLFDLLSLVLKTDSKLAEPQPFAFFFWAAGQFTPCQREFNDRFRTTNQQDPSQLSVV
jgi:hypothetical protein